MERVTAEQHPPMPLAQRNKDPKKQAAGRAGAAARKAKQEKILDELRNAKAAMREESDAPSVKPYEDAVHQPNKPSAVAKSRHIPDYWTYYIVAGLVALGGLALVFRDKITPNNSSLPPPGPTANPQARPRAPTSALLLPQPPIDSLLKTEPDPFDMQ